MDFEIEGKEFRADKLDAFKQFHVSRKLAPIIPTLIPVFVKIAKDGAEVKDLSAYGELLAPFADGLSAMTNEDSEYVLSVCLSVTKRKVGDNWAPVWSNSGKVLMFDDMNLGDMIQIVLKVVQDSLGNFIRGLLMSQTSSPD